MHHAIARASKLNIRDGKKQVKQLEKEAEKQLADAGADETLRLMIATYQLPVRCRREAVRPCCLHTRYSRVGPNFGQLQASYRDFQSNCWANLQILGQPCAFCVGAQHCGAHRNVVHGSRPWSALTAASSGPMTTVRAPARPGTLLVV